ncbi:hypothetical protein MTR62_13310, partial [Novosphingobium sp. 1949]
NHSDSVKHLFQKIVIKQRFLGKWHISNVLMANLCPSKTVGVIILPRPRNRAGADGESFSHPFANRCVDADCEGI